MDSFRKVSQSKRFCGEGLPIDRPVACGKSHSESGQLRRQRAAPAGEMPVDAGGCRLLLRLLLLTGDLC